MWFGDVGCRCSCSSHHWKNKTKRSIGSLWCCRNCNRNSASWKTYAKPSGQLGSTKSRSIKEICVSIARMSASTGNRVTGSTSHHPTSPNSLRICRRQLWRRRRRDKHRSSDGAQPSRATRRSSSKPSTNA